MNTELETPAAPIVDAKPKLNLKVDVAEKSACERHVTVTVPREDIELYFTKQFDEIVPKAEVPGFRTGKAPRKLVEKRFRKQLSDQVKGQLLMDSLSQVNDSESFSAISEPDLDFEQVQIPEVGDLTYEFNIEVRPEFELPQWQGLTLTRPEHEFTDKEIELEIQKLGQRFADLAPVDEPIQAGDFVVCNITSRYDNKTVSESEEVTIQVRQQLSLSDATIDGFQSLMIGAVANDKKTISAEISEFSDNEALRGKSVELEFEVLDVKRLETESAEALAEKFGMETREELENAVRKSAENRLQYAQREQIRDQISKSLTASADWALPPDLLRRQSRREIERAVMELRSSGFSEEEIAVRQNTLRKNILERTETLLKEHFILERIAEEEKVQDEPQDYEKEIARIAMQQNDSPRRVRASLERNGQMDSLRNMIIEQKVIDLITEKATFKATKFLDGDQSDVYAVDFFAAGEASLIPAAKYAGGDAAPIPGIKPERE